MSVSSSEKVVEIRNRYVTIKETLKQKTKEIATLELGKLFESERK